MDSSVQSNSKTWPTAASSHRPTFLLPHHHHHLHLHLEFSPHCPLHGGFLLQPNSHHHHHHLELSPDCPVHSCLSPQFPLQISNLYLNNKSPTTNFPISPNLASQLPPPQNPQFANPSSYNSNSPQAKPDETFKPEFLVMQDRCQELEEEDDEEIIFVLTDEWKEFFAKSEAKRRLAKQQAKKEQNNYK